ncbi:phospholipase/Carboxylesterase [Colletotrichum musicola]|uniref:Acyl-protein thioesterase 1 n=1 Tax=Colletotrichum musicola TaxID=2175873 RepID=A0A8H6KDC7_9PEZI|nr:phospholipase/Carboxylesterase [Colletotrichum musicola]
MACSRLPLHLINPQVLSRSFTATFASPALLAKRPQLSRDPAISKSLSTMADFNTRPPLVFPAPGKHTATVIFAHGLGDSGHGWAGAVENWRRRQRLDEVKFVLPHAPDRPITCNGGYRMAGWFDIKRLDGSVDSLRASEDQEGTVASAAYFTQLMKKEVDAGIPASRIVLGGFSQGGAMALFTGLGGELPLAGVVGLSCWLPVVERFLQGMPADKNKADTPVFLGHGDKDPVVRAELGLMSAEKLTELGFTVTRKIYPMAHSACVEELDDVEEFLHGRLPPTEK